MTGARSRFKDDNKLLDEECDDVLDDQKDVDQIFEHVIATVQLANKETNYIFDIDAFEN